MSSTGETSEPVASLTRGRRLRATLSCWLDEADRFAWETVQWQRSVASAVYLMLLNGLFWLCAFYLRRDQQLAALNGVAAAICVAEIVHVLRAVVGFKYADVRKDVQSQWQQFQESSFTGQIVQFICFVATLAPVRFVLAPFFYEFAHLVCDKFDQVLLCVLCASSAHQLQLHETEKAAWLAYAAAVTCAGGPAWRHHDVTGGVLRALQTAAQAVGSWLYNGFVAPIGRLCVRVWRWIRYYLFFEWVPPLIERIKRGVDAVRYFIRIKITDPVYAFVRRWLDRFARAYRRVRDCLVYWLGGYWIRPLKDWIREQWLLPVGVHVTRLRAAVAHVLFGRWIPPLVERVRTKIVRPAVDFSTRAFITFKALCRRAFRLAIYIVFGYWILDLARILKTQLTIFIRYSYKHWLVPFYYQCLEWKDQLVQHVKENILAPLVELGKICLKRFAHWLDNSVLRPTLLSMYLAASDLCILAHKNVLLPLWLVLEVYLRRTKMYAWVNYGEPLMDWLHERMPAQDDSDLRDFMPSQRMSTRASASPRSESEAELYDDLLPEEKEPSSEPVMRPKRRVRSNAAAGAQRLSRQSNADGGGASEVNSARSSSVCDRDEPAADDGHFDENEPFDEELDDFVRGLQFTGRATKDSDSSDDEFSLRRVVRRKRRPRTNVQTDMQAAAVGHHVDASASTSAHKAARQQEQHESVMDATETSASSLDQSQCDGQRQGQLASEQVVKRPAAHSQRLFVDTRPTGADAAGQPSASPSSAKDDNSWSDTLLAAYRRTSHKKPPSIGPSIRNDNCVNTEPVTPEPFGKDDDFEILDKNELDHLY